MILDELTNHKRPRVANLGSFQDHLCESLDHLCDSFCIHPENLPRVNDITRVFKP